MPIRLLRQKARRNHSKCHRLFFKINILINNDANQCDRSFAKFQPEDFDAIVTVHLSGAAYCPLVAWPHMKEAGY